MNPSYILKLKGRCLNCGAIVEERRADIIYSTYEHNALNDFDYARKSSRLKDEMSNHECSETESGFVQGLSMRVDVSSR